MKRLILLFLLIWSLALPDDSLVVIKKIGYSKTKKVTAKKTKNFDLKSIDEIIIQKYLEIDFDLRVIFNENTRFVSTDKINYHHEFPLYFLMMDKKHATNDEKKEIIKIEKTAKKLFKNQSGSQIYLIYKKRKEKESFISIKMICKNRFCLTCSNPRSSTGDQLF